MNPNDNDDSLISDNATRFLSGVRRYIETAGDPSNLVLHQQTTRAQMCHMAAHVMLLLDAAGRCGHDLNTLVREIAQEASTGLGLRVSPPASSNRPEAATGPLESSGVPLSEGTREVSQDSAPVDHVVAFNEHPADLADAEAESDDDDDQSLPDHAEQLLEKIVLLIEAWHETPADDLDGPDYTLGRLQGLAGSMVSLLDCAGWDEDEVVDALYELNEPRDINDLIKSYFERKE